MLRLRAARRLVVHHRDGRNVKPLLITLCIRCHVRLHHSLRLRRWVPEALLGLWRELHPGAPLQLQLLFVMTIAPVSGVRAEGQQEKPEPPQPKLALGEKLIKQPFRCAEAFIGQDDGFGLANESEIKPLACSRFRVSQSKPFQALAPSCKIKCRSARTASSTLSVSISMACHLYRAVELVWRATVWMFRRSLTVTLDLRRYGLRRA
jgi:hypothetical protein